MSAFAPRSRQLFRRSAGRQFKVITPTCDAPSRIPQVVSITPKATQRCLRILYSYCQAVPEFLRRVDLPRPQSRARVSALAKNVTFFHRWLMSKPSSLQLADSQSITHQHLEMNESDYDCEDPRPADFGQLPMSRLCCHRRDPRVATHP